MKKTLREFFDSRVKKGDECWVWTGSRTHKFGYGVCRERLAHRVSFEIHRGPIPDGLWVLHSCDNPPCVNPAHLFLGTVRDNVDDMLRKEREASKIDAEKARQIRELAMLGSLTREEIGERFGICRQAVSDVLRGETWWDRQPSYAERRAARREALRIRRQRTMRELAELARAIDAIGVSKAQRSINSMVPL